MATAPSIGDRDAAFSPPGAARHLLRRAARPDSQGVISHVQRVSRPGCRVYVGKDEIPRVLGGLGINILTTPKGVMTGRQARKQGLGGEVLCEVH